MHSCNFLLSSTLRTDAGNCVLHALSCYLSLILEHNSDTKLGKKNTVAQTLEGASAVAPPPGSATALIYKPKVLLIYNTFKLFKIVTDDCAWFPTNSMQVHPSHFPRLHVIHHSFSNVFFHYEFRIGMNFFSSSFRVISIPTSSE